MGIQLALSPDELRSDWDEVVDSGDNAAAALAHALEAGRRHFVTGFEVVSKGAALGNDVIVELKEGATIKWRTSLGNAALEGERTGVMFPRPMEFALATAVDLEAGAGGAGVILTLSMLGYTS